MRKFFQKVDQRERPMTAEERRRQAVDEGRGIGIGSLTKDVPRHMNLVRLIHYGERH